MQNWWQTSWGPKANKGCLPTTEPEDAPVEGACCQPKYVWCVNQDAAPSVAVGSSPQASALCSLSQMQKKLWQSSSLTHSKNAPESSQRGNFPQHHKGYKWQTHSKPHSQWNPESISAKIRNGPRTSLPPCLFHSFLPFPVLGASSEVLFCRPALYL